MDHFTDGQDADIAAYNQDMKSLCTGNTIKIHIESYGHGGHGHWYTRNWLW